MMRDDDLVALFESLDSGTPPDNPPYADDLWAELEKALTEQKKSGVKPSSLEADVVELSPRQDTTRSRFRLRGLVGVAVAAAALVMLVVALPFDQTDDVATEAGQPDATSTVVPSPSAQSAGPTATVVPIPGPRLTVPAEACRRYAETEPTLADLSERAPEGSVAPEDVQAATTALSVLRADLAASGEYTDSDIDSIDFALEALKEASVELEMGLDEQAAGSLGAASIAVEDLLLPSDTGVGVAVTCVGQ